MMGEWDLPEQAEFGEVPQLLIDRVLVEYNGPQIVTARDPRGLYLGVAADEDERAVRWIFAPITNTEFRALAAGAVATRDVMTKPQVYVIDVDPVNHNRICAWECDVASIGEDNLPDAGVLLPSATRTALMAEMPQPEFPELCLERPGAKSKGISFRAISELLNSFQRLWNALVQSVSPDGWRARGRWSAELADRAALSLAAATSGSLVLRIEPNDVAAFEQASAPFECLVNADDDSQALADMMARLGPRVQARYDELMSDIERHQLQLLARRRGGVAFLAPYKASRIRMALPQGVYDEPKTRPAIGYFIAFDTADAKFEFFDETAEIVYKGLVHPKVFAENPVVPVGPGETRAVFIEVTTRITPTKHATETYLLFAIAPPQKPASQRASGEPGTPAVRSG